MRSVHLILEINCYHSEPTWRERIGYTVGLSAEVDPRTYASVWCSRRPTSDDEEYTRVAKKLLGPVPMEDAKEAMKQIRESLRAAGVRVTEQVACDD